MTLTELIKIQSVGLFDGVTAGAKKGAIFGEDDSEGTKEGNSDVVSDAIVGEMKAGAEIGVSGAAVGIDDET